MSYKSAKNNDDEAPDYETAIRSSGSRQWLSPTCTTSANKTNSEDAWLTVNVSGSSFVIRRSLLERFPYSLLYQMSTARPSPSFRRPHNVSKGGNGNRSQSMSDDKSTKLKTTAADNKGEYSNEFYFQRSPMMFDLVILQCYITGKLHVPKWMCAESVLEELQFWGIDVTFACQCCAEEAALDVDEELDLSTSNDGGPEEEVGGKVEIGDSKTTLQAPKIETSAADVHRRSSALSGGRRRMSQHHTRSRRIWHFVNNPSSSIGAMIFAIVSMCFVIVSTCILTLESYKHIVACPEDINSTTISSTWSNNLVNISTNASLEPLHQDDDIFSGGHFSACTAKRILQCMELITIAWFSFETILRLISCPSWRRFFMSPLNLIDVVSTAPFYVEFILVYVTNYTDKNSTHPFILVLLIIRCLRVIRILKLARYFEDLRILGRTLNAARKELCMLFTFVLIAIFIFSSIVYQLEKDVHDSAFENIPASAWFSIATVTTVGYGDMTPKTVGGKIISCFACITGVMLTAFPVSILVEHFTKAYKEESRRMFVIPHFKTKLFPKKRFGRKNSIACGKDIDSSNMNYNIEAKANNK